MVVYGDLKSQLELSHTSRRSMGWQQGMAISELEKKEKKERKWDITLSFGLDQKMEVESG